MRIAAQRGSDRRTRHSRLRFPERRSGFDRRRHSGSSWRETYDAALRGYRDNRTSFLLVLATIVVFNYVDYMLTVQVLRAGGTELNPIMARLFEISPVAAATVKMGSVGAAALVLLLLQRYRRTLEASLALLVGFAALMFYHGFVAIRMLG